MKSLLNIEQYLKFSAPEYEKHSVIKFYFPDISLEKKIK
jgi:hypothetical protein